MWAQLFPKLFPNWGPFLSNVPTVSHSSSKVNNFRGTDPPYFRDANVRMKKRPLPVSKLVSVIEELSIVRAQDLAKYRIHPEVIKRAFARALIVKIGRGIYTRKGLAMNMERQILLAVKRVPHGIVYLESALMFHRLSPTGAGPIWLAIHPKARKPVVNGQLIRFVRFGGDALT